MLTTKMSLTNPCQTLARGCKFLYQKALCTRKRSGEKNSDWNFFFAVQHEVSRPTELLLIGLKGAKNDENAFAPGSRDVNWTNIERLMRERIKSNKLGAGVVLIDAFCHSSLTRKKIWHQQLNKHRIGDRIRELFLRSNYPKNSLRISCSWSAKRTWIKL